jgi:hypothetical protein
MHDDASILVFVPETRPEHFRDEMESHSRVSPQRKRWETVEPAWACCEDTTAEAAFERVVVVAEGQKILSLVCDLYNQEPCNEVAGDTWEEVAVEEAGHRNACTHDCTLVPPTCAGLAQSWGGRVATDAAGSLDKPFDVSRAEG